MNIVINTLLNFAQAYGSGTYNSSTYSTGTAASGSAGSAAGGATSQAAGGGLADTGFAVLLVVTMACLLVFAALLVRFARRKHANS